MKKQIEIANKLGVSRAAISYLLTGRRRPSWAMAQKLSSVFGKSPAWWMTAELDRIRRVLRRNDGSMENGGQNGNERRAA